MDGIDGVICNVPKSRLCDLPPDFLCGDTATAACHARNIPRNPIDDDKRRSWLENTPAFPEQAHGVIQLVMHLQHDQHGGASVRQRQLCGTGH